MSVISAQHNFWGGAIMNDIIKPQHVKKGEIILVTRTFEVIV